MGLDIIRDFSVCCTEHPGAWIGSSRKRSSRLPGVGVNEFPQRLGDDRKPVPIIGAFNFTKDVSESMEEPPDWGLPNRPRTVLRGYWGALYGPRTITGVSVDPVTWGRFEGVRDPLVGFESRPPR